MGETDRWSDIHPDMLNEITKRFYSYDDHIPLRLVCKEWNLKLGSNEIPWLLLPEETFKSSFDQEEEEIYSLMHLPVADEDILETKVLEGKGVYHAMLPGMQMLDILIRGSCYGWLITLTRSEGKMQMLNPFTNMHFDLPPLSTFPNIIEYNPGNDEYTCWDSLGKISNQDRDSLHKLQVWKVVINSPPNNDNKDFMAVAIYGPLQRLAFYKPNNKRWSDFTRNIYFEDVIFFKEKIYADYDGQLYEFDTNTESGTMGGIYAAPPIGFTRCASKLKYLIGCDNGNILMLVRKFDTLRGTEKELETKKFDIYELRKGSKTWSRLHSLGNFIVLIRLNSSVQMLPTNFLGKGNQIYYTDDLIDLKLTDHASTRDIGIFDLKNRSFRRILQDVKYDGDEGRNRGDAEFAVAAPLAAFVHNPSDVQELKANKEELRVKKLKDKEEVEDLTQEMAELRYRTLIPRSQASSLQLKDFNAEQSARAIDAYCMLSKPLSRAIYMVFLRREKTFGQGRRRRGSTAVVRNWPVFLRKGKRIGQGGRRRGGSWKLAGDSSK
ncbi:hypothetical protein AHAS_Ahas05G0297100 [Arachis hypogaea]